MINKENLKDEFDVVLNMEAFEYFKTQSKEYFYPEMFSKKHYKNPIRPWENEPQYRITFRRVSVVYVFNQTDVFFKFKFVNDFYKNNLTTLHLKEIMSKKNMFENLKANYIFDLNNYCNDLVYQQMVKTAINTKILPKYFDKI
jgi:hypothetical protein